MSVILFAHSLTSVTSLDPSLQPPCLPVSLFYLSVVPSFTSSSDCLPYPCLPSSPPPLFVSVILFASLPHLLYNIMASHPVHHHPVFSFFPSPIVHLLLFYFPNLPLVLLPPPPLYHNPIFFLLSLPYFVSMILFATHHHLYDSLPSTTASCLCSYPLPQSCVFYYCD